MIKVSFRGGRGSGCPLRTFLPPPLEIVLLKFIMMLISTRQAVRVYTCNEISGGMRVYTAIRLPFLFHTSAISSKLLSVSFSGDSMTIFITTQIKLSLAGQTSLLELTTSTPRMPQINLRASIQKEKKGKKIWGSMPLTPLVVICYTPLPSEHRTLGFPPPKTQNPV